MTSEVKVLFNKYIDWLKDNTSFKNIDDWVEITTPFLDRHNDMLQIYVKRQNDKIILSDGGEIINDLEISGLEFNSPKRMEILNLTLTSFGVKLKDDNSLVVIANESNFPLKKHNLIQTMLTLNDIFYLAKPYVKSLFLEDVKLWFDENDVRYTQNIKLTGESGFDHMFDFIIPKSRSKPERIIKLMNRPVKDQTQALAFNWIDTLKTRPENSNLYTIINNRELSISSEINDALRAYKIIPIPWTERQKFVNELVA